MGVAIAFANHYRREVREALKLPISTLEGEMSSRTEGGAKELGLYRQRTP
ncbi:hypothetical protein X749_16370 [Mesorhizobium sp. LNJC391B00]|nr:hypothetical protein X749_16370 [Mesorhizobium sp. LNJC391B00]